MDAVYRLADSTVAEPLINRWYATAFRISPVTASLMIDTQLELLRAWLANPKGTFDAANNPAFAGGSFVGVDPKEERQLRALLEQTVTELADQQAFGRALLGSGKWLEEHANGQSLEPLYPKLPEPLRGMVELLYDYQHRPLARPLEGLLYRTRLFKPELQSVSLCRVERDGQRPFMISTPRVHAPNRFELPLRFTDAALARLLAADARPLKLPELAELAGATEPAALLPWVAEDALPTSPRWTEKKVRVRYFGHACALVEWNGVSILTDPCIGPLPAAGGADRYSYKDLPERLDFAVVTHLHHDHYTTETLLRLRHRIDTLVVPRAAGLTYGDISLRRASLALGFKNVVEAGEMESLPLPSGGELIAVPFLGEHGDLPSAKSAYVIRAGDEQLMFGADSACLDEQLYESIRGAVGPVKTVFIGTECVGAPLSWLIEWLFPEKPERAVELSRRHHGSDAAGALRLMQRLGARRVYHYAMGQEPWLKHLGLGLSDDSTQMREGDLMLAQARRAGFEVAERFTGKGEVIIGEAPTRRAAPTADFDFG